MLALRRINHMSLLAVVFLGLMIISAWLLPYILDLDPYGVGDHLLQPPSTSNLLGTDDLGRDVLSRLIYGAQNSFLIAFIVVFVSLLTGSFLGLLSAVYGGIPSMVIDYMTNVIMSFPQILLAIVLLAIIGPGIETSIIAIALVTIPRFIRVVNTVATHEMKKDYIQAAQSFGLSRFKILTSELLPNCLSPIVVQATFAFSDTILTISILGFLRLGVSPPMAEWGSMLADVYSFMESSPYLVIYPGLCIWLTVLAINWLGDGLLELFEHEQHGSHLKSC